MYFGIWNFLDFGEKIHGAYTICEVTSPALCGAALGSNAQQWGSTGAALGSTPQFNTLSFIQRSVTVFTLSGINKDCK
jgi:hypothetical protein